MIRICSTAGCKGEAVSRGLCRKCYNLEYAKKSKIWREERIPSLKEAAETPAAPELPIVIPPELNAEIDALTIEQLSHWVMEKLYGWLPPNHPQTVATFFQQNPDRKRLSHYWNQWLTPQGKLEYPRDPANSMGYAWELLQSMLESKVAEKFESMLLEGRFHRLPQDLIYYGRKDATVFIARCALKAFLADLKSVQPPKQ